MCYLFFSSEVKSESLSCSKTKAFYPMHPLTSLICFSIPTTKKHEENDATHAIFYSWTGNKLGDLQTPVQQKWFLVLVLAQIAQVLPEYSSLRWSPAFYTVHPGCQPFYIVHYMPLGLNYPPERYELLNILRIVVCQTRAAAWLNDLPRHFLSAGSVWLNSQDCVKLVLTLSCIILFSLLLVYYYLFTYF